MDSKDIKNISDYYKNLFTCKFKTNWFLKIANYWSSPNMKEIFWTVLKLVEILNNSYKLKKKKKKQKENLTQSSTMHFK